MSVVTSSFNAAYLELISMTENAPLSSFNSTNDYNKLSSLGPSLPKISTPLPSRKPGSLASGSASASKTLTLSFKSIKPPYKFSTQLSNVSETISVFKLKNDLISTVPVLQQAGITSEDIKFLVKGKVIADTATLAGFDDGASFMCMVSAPANPAPANPAPTTTPTTGAAAARTGDADPEDDIDLASPSAAATALSGSTWAKIEAVLVADVGQAGASVALAKLQSAYN